MQKRGDLVGTCVYFVLICVHAYPREPLTSHAYTTQVQTEECNTAMARTIRLARGLGVILYHLLVRTWYTSLKPQDDSQFQRSKFASRDAI